MQQKLGISERRACKVLGQPRSVQRHKSNESWEQIDKKTMAKICEALGVEVGKLFEYVDK